MSAIFVGHPLAELGMGVQPGAHRGAAEGQLVEPGQRQLDALDVGASSWAT